MKVVLTKRDGQKWFRSYRNAILKTWPWGNRVAVAIDTMPILQYLIPGALGAVEYFKVFRYGILQTFGTLGSDLGMEPVDSQRAVEQFVARNEEIVRYFKESKQTERLFVIDWERKDKNEMFLEFMRFLNIEFSEKQLDQRRMENNGDFFPHRNNTSQLRRDILRCLCRAMSVVTVGAFILAVFCLCFTYVALF